MPAAPHFLMIPAIAALAFQITACHQATDKQQLLTINQGLTRSFASIQNNTHIEYIMLQNRLSDPETRYRAQQWAPAVLTNKERTEEVIGYIDTLVSRFTGSQPFPAEASAALFDTLIRFKHALIKVFPDSLITENEYRKKDWEDYCRHFPLFAGLSDSTFRESSFKSWADTTFDKDPLITLLALNKLKIDIALSAQLVARYCRWQTEPQGDRFDVFEPLITLNSDVVKPGEIVDLKAGIGTYSSKVEPRVTIAGSVMPLNAAAFADYTFKASKQPGRHTIPVKIEYYKPDGTKAWYDRTVSYYVIQP